MQPKFLIGIPSPRDIEVVQDAMLSIDFIDKFYAKYMPEYFAYPAMQDFFLKHDYDYLVLWADDLMVQQKDFLQLIADIKDKAYDVIGGTCQIDNTNFSHVMAISRFPVYPKRSSRFRSFEKFADYYCQDGDVLPKYKDNPIIKTKWQGFPLTCISRSVLERIRFRNDAVFNGIPIEQGCCTDDSFCWDCIQDEIPMYTDLRIRMDHLRLNENSFRTISWVDKKPHYKFVKATNRMLIHTYEKSAIKF